jgi:hypothetical protein
VRIDLQIRAHLGQQVAAKLFLAILERGEFVTEVEAAVAAFSFVGPRTGR